MRSLDEISIARCKALLDKGHRKYSNEEIEKLRDFLYLLIEIDLEHFKKKLTEKNAETSNNKHEGIYRRTG